MQELQYEIVQGQIGYRFKNLDLLQQAFIRRSYSRENGGADNEILEFIGDKVLDIAVVRFLTEKYGYISEAENECSEFYSELSEGKLTQIKAKMVRKESLARRIDELGFSDFLIMGQGDIQNGVAAQSSVKEDLFEAILGAAAIDSNWDYEILQSTAEIMLNPESFLDEDEENYVQLIQDWELDINGCIPWFKYYDRPYNTSIYYPFDGVRQRLPLVSMNNNYKFTCELKLLDTLPIFQGYGSSKSEARKNVCQTAYDWLEKQGMLPDAWSIRDEIENPNKNEAISQLEILARRGYFSIPSYEFEQTYDINGNPIWKAECHIKEKNYYFSAESSSKKDAKKTAAFNMLMYVLEHDEEDE